MATPSSTREKLIEKISELNEEEMEDLLDYLNMLSDPDELTPEEAAEVDATRAEMKQGKFTTLDQFKRENALD